MMMALCANALSVGFRGGCGEGGNGAKSVLASKVAACVRQAAVSFTPLQ
jgi:hypothetical protein